jgi:hypothetical protein
MVQQQQQQDAVHTPQASPTANQTAVTQHTVLPLIPSCCVVFAAAAVAKAGYVLPASRNQPPVQCTGSSYAPAYNRLRACLPCQSGLQAPPDYSSPRIDRNDVCQVPPGKFWELNVVRDCPKGLYRSNFVRTDNRSAISCLSCPEGWTTAATASQAVGMCNGEQAAAGSNHSCDAHCS